MVDKQKYFDEIRAYYTQSNWLYKYVWYRGKSLGLHFGFADRETKSHTEALINQYKYVIKKGQIGNGMRVLDAGCGVGGASLYIAKVTGARCVGVSLVESQVKEAGENALRQNIQNKVEFLVGDYAHTNLKPESFDVVIGIESICYAAPKRAFLAEAYRLLKPGGRLVITDGYCKHNPQDKTEIFTLKKFCSSWRLANLITYQKMSNEIRKIGFSNVKLEDKTDEIAMSANKMRMLVKWWNLGEILLGWVDLPVVAMARANAMGMRYWLRGLDAGLFGYFAHEAKKPAITQLRI